MLMIILIMIMIILIVITFVSMTVTAICLAQHPELDAANIELLRKWCRRPGGMSCLRFRVQGCEKGKLTGSYEGIYCVGIRV